MLGNFFPHRDTPLVNAPIAAYRALLFALRVSSDALPEDPTLQPFLQQFCHTLEQAGIFAAWLAYTHVPEDAAFCDSFLMPQIAAREPVLLEGGYDSPGPGGGHAAWIYLWPLGGDETLLVVADRLAGRHHPEDRPNHPLPLVYRFKTAELTGPAGKAFFCALMALQRRDQVHTLDQFYDAIAAGVAQCHGVLEVGFDADGHTRQGFHVGGQAALKSNTCTISSGMTLLHFGLHAAFGTLDPCADPTRRDAVQALYKQLKDHCRGAVLAQFVAALKQVRRRGDAAEVAAYEAALARTRDYLNARANQPHMAGHLAAIKMV